MASRPAFARRALWQRQTHRPHLQSGRRRQSDQPFPVDEYGHCRSGVFFAHRQTSRVMAGALSRATLAADCRTGGKPAPVKIPAPQAGRSVGLRYDRVVNQARRIRLMLRTGASRPLKAKRAFPSSSGILLPSALHRRVHRSSKSATSESPLIGTMSAAAASRTSSVIWEGMNL